MLFCSEEDRSIWSVVLFRGGYLECCFVQRRIGVFGVLFCSAEDRGIWSVVLFSGG